MHAKRRRSMSYSGGYRAGAASTVSLPHCLSMFNLSVFSKLCIINQHYNQVLIISYHAQKSSRDHHNILFVMNYSTLGFFLFFIKKNKRRKKKRHRKKRKKKIYGLHVEKNMLPAFCFASQADFYINKFVVGRKIISQTRSSKY